ncbi:hypothetical protein HMI56_002438 [Coelomomyces lativittatus]|nr:hypothetical protein HMI56_002438 [Coelomomyces lativittatus]
MFTALHFYRQKRHYLNSPHANFGSRTRWIIRGTMDTLALGSGYLYYQHEIKKDQKVKDACMHITRPAYFWSRLFPIYLHYRWTEFTVKHKTEMEQNEAFEVLHQKYAPVVLNTILHLRGLFIKLGQVGTTRADFVPEAYRKALHKLLDDVPSTFLRLFFF